MLQNIVILLFFKLIHAGNNAIKGADVIDSIAANSYKASQDQALTKFTRSGVSREQLDAFRNSKAELNDHYERLRKASDEFASTRSELDNFPKTDKNLHIGMETPVTRGYSVKQYRKARVAINRFGKNRRTSKYEADEKELRSLFGWKEGSGWINKGKEAGAQRERELDQVLKNDMYHSELQERSRAQKYELDRLKNDLDEKFQSHSSLEKKISDNIPEHSERYTDRNQISDSYRQSRARPISNSNLPSDSPRSITLLTTSKTLPNQQQLTSNSFKTETKGEAIKDNTNLYIAGGVGTALAFGAGAVVLTSPESSAPYVAPQRRKRI